VLYTPDPSGASSQVIPNLVQTFINAFSGLPPVLPGEGSTVLNAASTGSGIVNAILNMQQSSSDPNSPNAFVNYVLFDENMNLVPGGSGAIQIGNANTSWQNLSVQKIAIPQNGFLRAFSSNTSTADIRINNFQVTHMQGVLQEEYNYYPYGLIFDQSHALTGTIIPTNYLYNGKELQQNEFGDGGNGLELYDYGARMYDVQIGRWCGVDASADKSRGWSPYSYAIGNPVKYIDPDGREIINVEGGVTFTGADAKIAYTAIQAQATSKEGLSGGVHFVLEASTPAIYKHTLDAFRQGHPNVLHYDGDKKRADQPRYQATKWYPSRAAEGLQRDEYPYASTFEGGLGAAVAYVPAEENGMQGGELRGLTRMLHQGDAILVVPIPKDREPDAVKQPSPVNNVITAAGAAYILYKVAVGVATWECGGCGILLTP
jgi:RHS repeat-associated protein